MATLSGDMVINSPFLLTVAQSGRISIKSDIDFLERSTANGLRSPQRQTRFPHCTRTVTHRIFRHRYDGGQCHNGQYDTPCPVSYTHLLVYSSERDGLWQLYTSTIVRKEEKQFTYATELKEERLTNSKVCLLYTSVSPLIY